MLTLTAEGVEPLALDRSLGWVVRAVDLGSPDVREVINDRPNADGAIDTTTHVGARPVVLNLRLVSHPNQQLSLAGMVDRLALFASPKLRATLIIEDGLRQVSGLRGVPLVAPITTPTHRDVTLSFVAANGIIESVTLNVETVFPSSGENQADGIEFDGIEFDGVEFPAVDAPGVGQITNAGNFDAYPLLRLFGPFGDEGNAADETVVGNLTTGRTLTLVGTAIAAGDYLEIDTRAKTLRVNGLASQSRQNRLKFPESRWFTLVPAGNEIAFRPDTVSGNAQAEIRWRDAYL